MVRHIEMMNVTDTDMKEYVKNSFKELKNLIKGIVAMNVVVDTLNSENQLLVDSLFQSEEHYEEYINHPERKKFENELKDIVKDNKSIDYIE